MNKFHDVLRILSSVLLGALVREYDQIVKGFEELFGNERTHFLEGQMANATAVLLLFLFLRNIHGSSRWDEVTKDSGFSPSYESTYFGRILTYGLALAGLFLGPSLVGHHFSEHAKGTGEMVFGVILFLPYIVYALWDLLLWIFQGSWGSDALEQVGYRWVVLDCIGLSVVLVFVYLNVWTKSRGNTELTALCFLLVSSVLVLGDYYANRSFYFPDSAPGTASTGNESAVPKVQA